MLQQRAELGVDLAQLLAVQVEVDRLLLLADEFKRTNWKDAGTWGAAPKMPASFQLVRLNSSAIALKLSAMGYPFFAAGLAPSLAGSARFRFRYMLNSETRRLSTLAALTSTSTGCASHGEASMLRISVDTRAFDCA